MEEKLKLTLLNQQITLTYSQILQLKPLIKEDLLKTFQVPFIYKKFTPNLQIFNICLYYLIVVDKNLDEIKQVKFRQICLDKMTKYYIANHMNFQLYEYGVYSAKTLGYPLNKTLHILYFLVYGRLASKPYITNLIMVTEKKNVDMRQGQINNRMNKVDAQSSDNKSRDSRHFPIFYQQNQYQTQQFKQQLKKVFSPNNKPQLKKNKKKIQNKRYFNLKKIYPDEFQERYQSSTISKQDSQYKNCLSTIPLKVQYKQNSSIISKINNNFHYNYKLQKGMNKNTKVKKIHIRKQKFHDNINQYDKFYEELLKADFQKQKKQILIIKNQNLEKQNRQNLTQNTKKYNKYPYEYYKNILSRIKIKNDELDVIRNQCTHHSTARQTSQLHTPFSHSKINQFALLKTQNQTKTSNLMDDYKKEEENQFFEEFNMDDAGRLFSVSLMKNKYSNKGKLMKGGRTIKTTVNSENSGGGGGCSGQTLNYAVITRKNDKSSEDVNEKRCMEFTNLQKNKFKLQKYKKDYRQFLKTQMFQNPKAFISSKSKQF